MKVTGDPGPFISHCSTGLLLPVEFGLFSTLPEFLDATTLLVNLTTQQERSDGDDHRRDQTDTGHRLEHDHAYSRKSQDEQGGYPAYAQRASSGEFRTNRVKGDDYPDPSKGLGVVEGPLGGPCSQNQKEDGCRVDPSQHQRDGHQGDQEEMKRVGLTGEDFSNVSIDLETTEQTEGQGSGRNQGVESQMAWWDLLEELHMLNAKAGRGCRASVRRMITSRPRVGG